MLPLGERVRVWVWVRVRAAGRVDSDPACDTLPDTVGGPVDSISGVALDGKHEVVRHT